MNLKKVQFTNRDGLQLAGRIELPADRQPHSIALFAHCFTCSGNSNAIRNISRVLVQQGYGVLRFDFTGLGESEGEFSETNFSANVGDLEDAAAFLEKEYQAPTLLVGHSLGGAAAIFAAGRIPSVQAVATIGAPASLEHVTKLFSSQLSEIKEKGKATVILQGREFTINMEFLEALENNDLPATTKTLRKPLLLFHAPQDSIVSIDNAEILYKSAHHPKSFVSLDGANHLLDNQQDSLYVGTVIAAWAGRYLKPKMDATEKPAKGVVAGLGSEDGFTTQIIIGEHVLTADEPLAAGGNDLGPSPYEFLSAGLAACTAMTLHMYARRKGWPLEEVRVQTSYGKDHAKDCKHCDSPDAKIDTFKRKVELLGFLDEKQRARFLEIANKCPVHKTLHSEIQIVTELAPIK